jgi:hypothetical protein
VTTPLDGDGRPAGRPAGRFDSLERSGLDEHMADLRIDCINKTPRNDPHDRIRNVGGVAGGQRWTLTEDHVISSIDGGEHSFYVERPAGHRVNVIVATRLGHKYLKTTADGEQPDNLLALPGCP